MFLRVKLEHQADVGWLAFQENRFAFKIQVHIMILIVFFFLFSCREPIMPFVNNVTACDWFSYVEKIPRKFGICSDCQPSQIFFSAKWKLEIREIHNS